MIKYLSAGVISKLFSLNGQTESIYRYFGNILLTQLRLREGLPERYLNRIRLFFEIIEKNDLLKSGNKLLELGTGWVHWESTCVRLFYDVDLTLFDICDNRLLKVFKLYFGQFSNEVDNIKCMGFEEKERVYNLLNYIVSVESFDEFYKDFEISYIIDADRTLEQFEGESFDMIFSFDVLEHIDIDILPKYVSDINELLKPGGYSVHQIDISDHYAYYDPGMHPKNYLKYSNKTWKRFFESKVQYFNRVQRSDWLNLFKNAGFTFIEEQNILFGDIKQDIHEDHEYLDKYDTECITLVIVHQKSF